MNYRGLSRRDALRRTGTIIGAAMLGTGLVRAADGPSASGQPPSAAPTGKSFRFCLNTATIRGQKVGIVKEIEIAAAAGYDALEPWIDSIQDYVKGSGSMSDLRKRAQDSGISIESAIGFPEWIVDDETRRNAGLERARREMDLVAQIGGKRLAAPPSGATDLPKMDPLKAAERYRALLEIGDQVGVIPQFELWGFSKNFNRLGECVWIAMETGHPKACVLADIFHMHKGGTDFTGLGLLGPDTVQVLHMNDYPAEPARDKIDDSFRTYPGDGVAPVPKILQALGRNGGTKVLSLELFSRKIWAEDPLAVAKTGLAKMKDVVQKASAG